MSQMRVALAGTTAQSTLQAVLVDAWLPRAAAARPDVPAVNALRYADLLARADAGARRLAARGARAGDRVGVALPAGEAFAVALHACLRLGAVVVPLDLRLPDDERARRAGAAPSSSRRRSTRATATSARPCRAQHDLGAPAIVVLHERDERGVQARRADLRQLALERARVGDRARLPARRALAVRAAARPTSAGSRSSCAR